MSVMLSEAREVSVMLSEAREVSVMLSEAREVSVMLSEAREASGVEAPTALRLRPFGPEFIPSLSRGSA